MAKSFSAQCDALARMCKKRQLAVFRDSAQAMAHEANLPRGQGGNLPLDTGYLMNSFAGSASGLPGVGGLPVEIVILTAELGEKVFFGWVSSYARRLEYGFQGQDSLGRTYNQKGAGFLRLAVQNWPKYVSDAVTKVQAIK